MDDLALCIGVGNVERKAYLVRLDDPMSVLTRFWQKGEEFSVGNWYKQGTEQPRKYRSICNVVPTFIIRQMDSNGCGKSTIELVMPVFFPPDLSGLSSLGNVPSINNSNSLCVPVCPLLGSEGVECLSAVRWSQSCCSYSDGLYALKINLSYTVGLLAEWTPQNVGQLKPWDYGECPIVIQLCMTSRKMGIVVEQIACQRPSMKGFSYAVLLDKNAELLIAIVPDNRKLTVGEYRACWPFKLNCYDCPMFIALDCPQEELVIQDCIGLSKIRNDLFELSFLSKDWLLEKAMAANYFLPWLGILMDPFRIIDDSFDYKKERDQKMPPKIRVRPHWHLAKRSIAWTVYEDDSLSSNSSAAKKRKALNETNTLRVHCDVNGHVEKDVGSSADKNINTSGGPASPQIIFSEKKNTIGVLLTIRTSASDAVFLFWDTKTAKFLRRVYAKFHKSLTFQFKLGEWFELDYLDVPQNPTHVVIFNYSKAERHAVTRVRDDACAQFSTNQDRFVNVWHTVFPCKEKNSYYEDKGWWPWLCRKCFPGLREMAPPTTGIGANVVPPMREALVGPKVTGANAVPLREMASSTRKSTGANSVPLREMPAFGKGTGANAVPLKAGNRVIVERDKSKSPELEALAKRMSNSLGISLDDLTSFELVEEREESIDSAESARSSSPIIIMKDAPDAKKRNFAVQREISGRRPAPLQHSLTNTVFTPSVSKTVSAVLMAVRPNGDSVFLIFNSDIGKFTHRVYSEPPDKIKGNPKIGKWYKLEHKQSSAGSISMGQKISNVSVTVIENPPVETRVRDGLAQFKTRDKFISVWHKRIDEWHKYRTSVDGLWWPSLCTACFPSSTDTSGGGARESLTSAPVSLSKQPQEMFKPWTEKHIGHVYTESEDSDGSTNFERVAKTNGVKRTDIASRPLAAYSPPVNGQLKSTVCARPPPVSVSGNLFRRSKSPSPPSVTFAPHVTVGKKTPDLSIPMAARKEEDSKKEETTSRNEMPKKMSLANSIDGGGGFGSARIRRFAASSALSYESKNNNNNSSKQTSPTPPCPDPPDSTENFDDCWC